MKNTWQWFPEDVPHARIHRLYQPDKNDCQVRSDALSLTHGPIAQQYVHARHDGATG